MVDAGKAKELVLRPQSRNWPLRAARESIVLLKNDKGLLPLSASKYAKIAVIWA